MKRIGPGIFFAFFGATILGASVADPLRFQNAAPPLPISAATVSLSGGAPVASYFGPTGGLVDRTRAQDASNQITVLASLPPRSDLDGTKRAQYEHAVNILSNYLPDILQCSFGEANVTAYAKVKDEAGRDSQNYARNFTSAELDSYKQIKSFKGE